MHQTKMSLKKNAGSNKAHLRNTDKTKTDVYELCGLIQQFKYRKSYA